MEFTNNDQIKVYFKDGSTIVARIDKLEDNSIRAIALSKNEKFNEGDIIFLNKLDDKIEKIGMDKTSKVTKRKDGYHVISESGKNLGGPYKTKEEATKRLQQVEYFKHKKGKKFQWAFDKHKSQYKYDPETNVIEKDDENVKKVGMKKQASSSQDVEVFVTKYLGKSEWEYDNIVKEILESNLSYEEKVEKIKARIIQMLEYDSLHSIFKNEDSKYIRPEDTAFGDERGEPVYLDETEIENVIREHEEEQMLDEEDFFEEKISKRNVPEDELYNLFQGDENALNFLTVHNRILNGGFEFTYHNFGDKGELFDTFNRAKEFIQEYAPESIVEIEEIFTEVEFVIDNSDIETTGEFSGRELDALDNLDDRYYRVKDELINQILNNYENRGNMTTESNHKQNIALYYPYGKSGDSIEVQIINELNNKYKIVSTENGKKDCEFMGYIFDPDGETVSEDELIFIKKSNKMYKIKVIEILKSVPNTNDRQYELSSVLMQQGKYYESEKSIERHLKPGELVRVNLVDMKNIPIGEGVVGKGTESEQLQDSNNLWDYKNRKPINKSSKTAGLVLGQDLFSKLVERAQNGADSEKLFNYILNWNDEITFDEAKILLDEYYNHNENPDFFPRQLPKITHYSKKISHKLHQETKTEIDSTFEDIKRLVSEYDETDDYNKLLEVKSVITSLLRVIEAEAKECMEGKSKEAKSGLKKVSFKGIRFVEITEENFPLLNDIIGYEEAAEAWDKEDFIGAYIEVAPEDPKEVIKMSTSYKKIYPDSKVVDLSAGMIGFTTLDNYMYQNYDIQLKW